MPRRSILSASERDSLLALPDSRDDLIRRYTFSESDLSIIRQRRGAANRLGFAVQLCYLRYPGIVLGVNQLPLPALLHLVAGQLRIPVERWAEYGERAQTRREHLVDLQTVFGFEPFTTGHHRLAVEELMETAMQTDQGIVLATALVEMLRERAILQPRLDVIEDVCAEAITRANRRIYKQLNHSLTEVHRERLDRLLVRRAEGIITQLAWLRQAPLKPNSKQMLEHIDRLRAWRALDLPAGIERQVHQNRLLKIAREGGQMTSADLMRLERQRRYATLVALAVEGTATITDEVIGLHDRIVGKLFNAAKHKHQEQFQADGRAINEKLRLYGKVGQALLAARQNGSDPFAAIETIVSWEDFAASITEAQKLAQPEDFDFLHRIGEGYATLRRYAPELLDVLGLHAAPAAKPVLEAIELLREMNAGGIRELPDDAPLDFIRERWAKLIFTDAGIDRRYYELCALSELKNALRSGDIWVEGSRQFKNFNEYLIPSERFAVLRGASELPLAVDSDCERYLKERVDILNAELQIVDQLAAANDLPDAILTDSGLTVYIERAVRALYLRGQPVDPALLKYLSPLGWEHINLTGDYQWNGKKPAAGRFRSLRTLNLP